MIGLAHWVTAQGFKANSKSSAFESSLFKTLMILLSKMAAADSSVRCSEAIISIYERDKKVYDYDFDFN